ncbi:hypothetical protein CAPTEDRAFT_195679 [Capitella teleta]|uniref:Uncharacterized protein n=1 Tax=Capitella teleta TaxID=283909 RepID=X1ZVD5_CAPTE|nr:hypothetical protein CAPTEDRAFT_195679 [Capitella teleta]|eukprot:ELT88393.1 hypothetical protein CAPTEDRAFT_195679 [Capitella teleta]
MRKADASSKRAKNVKFWTSKMGQALKRIRDRRKKKGRLAESGCSETGLQTDRSRYYYLMRVLQYLKHVAGSLLDALSLSTYEMHFHGNPYHERTGSAGPPGPTEDTGYLWGKGNFASLSMQWLLVPPPHSLSTVSHQ